MYCGECGNSIKSTWNFCKSCGSKTGPQIATKNETSFGDKQKNVNVEPVPIQQGQSKPKKSGSIFAIAAFTVMAVVLLIVFLFNQNSNQTITLDKMSVESAIEDQFKEQLIGADAICPELMQGTIGTEFRCVANFTNDTSVNIIVTISNSSEHFDWHSG